ncbi:MAG: nascent polypeptide-associated complex protein [Candidatus Altiarchaeales archaeon HGW-Altiarchaeales-3]|nr:MAG: nascent polypeptide-associated complex protein [Candidatus Altiarchaeales archaeon HGW-Altiarchaeales-3]
MFPGGMNPKQMKTMMKRMGIKMDEIDANEVIIRCDDKEIVITDPAVSRINMQGQISFQISGNEEEREIEEEEVEPEIDEDDVKMVAEQTGIGMDEAREALEDAGGDIAEAIMNIKGI